MPFGGGIDSSSRWTVRGLADAALFVVRRPPTGSTRSSSRRGHRPGGGASGTEIDPQLLRSAELGFLNGHAPVTGILSAIAVLAAVLDDRDT